jgi:hypothetical protein
VLDALNEMVQMGIVEKRKNAHGEEVFLIAKKPNTDQKEP